VWTTQNNLFGEQVASPAGRTWLNGVFTDLEALGYACAGADLCAAGVAAPHIRQRLFWVVHTHGAGSQGWNMRPDQTEKGGELPVEPRSIDFWGDFDAIPCADQKTRRIESGTFPLAHGVPARVGKLSAYGNAIVPQVAAAFIVSAIEAGV